MQYRPTDAELLDTVADLLGEVMDDVSPHLRHRVRVAENLLRIVEREARSGAASAERERSRLRELLGHDGAVDELRAELALRLRRSDDETFDQAAWRLLVDVARDDLAIAKPGHDRWEGT